MHDQGAYLLGVACRQVQCGERAAAVAQHVGRSITQGGRQAVSVVAEDRR
ncbi:hypothetical protein Airi02_096600 [Actinoallomurus iriomotensis]|uniref:Uncharacterized protein n=1 Tax=Actinoallomurus iriomotensis TaxID=478107 RepID=A0A9W6W669_9ACTN|nr:hypothetical protein Airi02_096600 [Actinoallomurus iriomotensis]